MNKNETRQPTFSLSSFKSSEFETTNAALKGAEALRMTEDDIEAMVACLQPGYFYKSMLSMQKKFVWQDVYRVPYQGHDIYLKISTGIYLPFRIVSLKKGETYVIKYYLKTMYAWLAEKYTVSWATKI